MNLSHQKYDCGCAGAARDRVLDLTRPDNRPQRRKKGSLRDKSPATEPTLTKLLDRPLRRRLHGGVGSTFPAVRKEALLQAAEDTRQPSRRRKSAGPNIKALLIALLASVVFAAGCGGSEETQSGSAEETTTDHEARMKLPRRARRAPKAEVPTGRSRLASKATQGLGSPGRAALVTKKRVSKDKSPRASLTNWGVDSWSARSRNKTALVL